MCEFTPTFQVRSVPLGRESRSLPEAETGSAVLQHPDRHLFGGLAGVVVRLVICRARRPSLPPSSLYRHYGALVLCRRIPLWRVSLVDKEYLSCPKCQRVDIGSSPSHGSRLVDAFCERQIIVVPGECEGAIIKRETLLGEFQQYGLSPVDD